MDWEHNDNYLIHYGVKGQKWGERRYRNEDGTLTDEGRKHYGYGSYERYKDIHDKYTAFHRSRNFAKWREKRHRINLEKAKISGNEKKIKKYQSKLDAQKKANEDMDKYVKDNGFDNTSRFNRDDTLKTSAQSLYKYHQARARGESVTRAFVETAIPIYGTIKRMKRTKAKYGKYIVYSGLEESKNNSL